MSESPGCTQTTPTPAPAPAEEPAPVRRSALSYLGWTALGTLVPGLGMWAAGKRLTAAVVLGLGALGVAAAVYVAVTVPLSDLLGMAVRPASLRRLAVGLAALAVLWLLVALVSHHLLVPRGASVLLRLVGALTVVAVSAVTVGPLVVGARYASVQRGLVDTVFQDAGENVSITAPVIEDRADPFADKPRVNVLLLGSDAGSDRIGTRTDTVILASIDTRTGDTVLFSLPRNLQRVPFPAESPLARVYPRGFTGSGDAGEWLLNAIYPNVPAAHPDVFTGATNPGADAIKLGVSGALGLDVDYYVMVDLAGFQALVDALGGVTIDVQDRVPLGTHVLTSGLCARPTGWIEPGVRKMDGATALAYARARCGAENVTSDYDRMRRQRCVIGSMIDQADPYTVLRRYQQLASVTKDIVQTDIPQDLLPAFTDLSLEVKDAQVRTLPFTDAVINPSRPDYPGMRALVRAALVPAPAADAGSGTADPRAAPSTGPGAPGASTATGASPSAAATSESAGAQDLSAVCRSA